MRKKFKSILLLAIMCILMFKESMHMQVLAAKKNVNYTTDVTTKACKKIKKNKEYTNIMRCGLGDVPSGVRSIIKEQCTGNSWYVIKTDNKKYVYYNSLPRDYAFKVSGKKLKVRDIGRHTGIYVLLSLGNNFNFKLYYNAKPVVFTTIDAN